MEFKVRNIKREEIHHYGFAFEGKKVLIGKKKENTNAIAI